MPLQRLTLILVFYGVPDVGKLSILEYHEVVLIGERSELGGDIRCEVGQNIHMSLQQADGRSQLCGQLEKSRRVGDVGRYTEIALLLLHDGEDSPGQRVSLPEGGTGGVARGHARFLNWSRWRPRDLVLLDEPADVLHHLLVHLPQLLQEVQELCQSDDRMEPDTVLGQPLPAALLSVHQDDGIRHLETLLLQHLRRLQNTRAAGHYILNDQTGLPGDDPPFNKLLRSWEIKNNNIESAKELHVTNCL